MIESVGSGERGGRHTRGMRRGSAGSDAHIKRGERSLANLDSSGYSNSEIHETSPGRCSTGDGGDLHSKGKLGENAYIRLFVIRSRKNETSHLCSTPPGRETGKG